MKRTETKRFQQFVETVKNKIRDFLPNDSPIKNVEIQHVKNNNDQTLTGLVIHETDVDISAVIYLEPFYEEYCSGKKMGQILNNIAKIYVRHKKTNLVDMEWITNFVMVKHRIIPRLIKMDWNTSLLENRPYNTIADLAVTYCVLMPGYGKTTEGLVSVTNDLMSIWGIDKNVIHDMAVRNLPVLLPGIFKPTSSIIAQSAYVLTNGERLYGASTVLDEEIMKSVIKQIGDDFYILPSSIHELIVIPSRIICGSKFKRSDIDAQYLMAMVSIMNQKEVGVSERLSDHIYGYNRKDGLFSVE